MANEERLIDANALMEKIEKSTASRAVKGVACVFVNGAPTVDAVEVVRCKDCKHRYIMSSGHSFCREHFPMGKYDNDFCSYGERREGNVE